MIRWILFGALAAALVLTPALSCSVDARNDRQDVASGD